MAAAYLVTLPIEGGQTLRHNVNAIVVYADDATKAKEAAGARFGGDSAWTGATATAIAAGDYAGWTLRIRLKAPNSGLGVYAVDVSVLGDATDNTIDELAAKAVIALNALSNIAGSAYNSTTQVLTVSDATDALGNHAMTVEFSHADYELPVASLVSTIVDEGVAAAVTSVTFLADAVAPPKFYGAATLR
jgi:hypothetical protein